MAKNLTQEERLSSVQVTLATLIEVLVEKKLITEKELSDKFEALFKKK